jgi:hypothetical protein
LPRDCLYLRMGRRRYPGNVVYTWANLPEKVNIQRLIVGGLTAGLLINAVEYFVHGMLLDPQWTAAFAALGKTPKGWTTFIPSNFLVGIFGVLVYARLRPKYGPGLRTALRSGLAIWIVFWVIPTMALQPMELFPNVLLFTTIAVGLLDSIPAVALGAWIYRP